MILRASALVLAALVLISAAGCDEERQIASTEFDRLRVPTDYANIVRAMEEADPGDMIVLEPGIHTGTGFKDITVVDKPLTIIAEEDAHTTILDLGGSSLSFASGFKFENLESPFVISGITIRNGYASVGSAVNIQGCEPTFINCVFENNHATTSGGAIRCKSAQPRFVNCTFVSNSTDMVGAAAMLLANSAATFKNCIIAGSTAGEAIYVSDNGSTPILECCNIYDNAGGDWIEKIASQASLPGNMSLDPLFCNGEIGDFRLDSESPCSRDNSYCGERIGALGADCE